MKTLAPRAMDNSQESEACIRREARADAYRAAFSTREICTFGYLLGTAPHSEAPFFEFVLVSTSPATIGQLWRPSDFLRPQRAAAEQVAQLSGTEVVGLFAAWDDGKVGDHKQLLGLWMDTARAERLPYFIRFPTNMYETFWATCLYDARSFAASAALCRSVVGRRSDEPRDNPRRVRKMWRELLQADNANLSR